MLAASTVTAKATLPEEHRGEKPVPGESRSPDKPKPINTGLSQAEGIAKFACRTKYADLTAERRERLKVSVLDSLACAINALGAPPIEACRAQAKEFGGLGDGQVFEHNGVDEGEDRRVGTDAERQGEDARDGETRGLTETAKGVAEVVQHGGHGCSASREGSQC